MWPVQTTKVETVYRETVSEVPKDTVLLCRVDDEHAHDHNFKLKF